jgi:tRNA threonylcarbamoyladenosine biosynthesis protein TsaB
MPLILNIDTATDKASVSLALNGQVLQERVNGQAMDHAAWIHTAIKELMHVNNGYKMESIDAVAVVAGPGSYTGLRVGMATAKGLCYALNIPLISLNTLTIMAHATVAGISSSLLLCPMLDARRMEVFTALYDASLRELVPPCAMILSKDSFSEWLDEYRVIFFGSGSNKWKELVQHEHAIFKDGFYMPRDVATVSNDTFAQHVFSELAYTEPIYLKDFYSYPGKITGQIPGLR